MSYIDGPQLTFSGDFQADVSTVNNDVRHYDNATFEARFQQFRQGATLNGWWNPIGSGAFRLLNCRVRRAVGVDGGLVSGDAVIGAGIGGSSDRVAAKMVDLDPQWQFGSELWGLRIEIIAGNTPLLAGQFEPAGFRDVWLVPPAGRAFATARYTSALTGVEWPDIGRSPFLDALRAATAGDVLSVRLVTFAHDGDHSSPRFTIGTLLGAIGPYRPGEPFRFVRGRRFAPKVLSAGWPPLVNFFDGQVSAGGDAVTVDLGNALPVADRIGGMMNIGELQLGLLVQDLDEGAPVKEGRDYVPLGRPIPYRDSGWLQESSGIERASVPTIARAQVASSPLALIGPGPAGTSHKVLIRETPGGWHIRADEDLHRVDAGGSATVSIYASRFGTPVSDAISVQLQPPQSGLGGASPGDPHPPTAPIPTIGTPATAVDLSRPSPTDQAGRTTRTISCSDPGHPRGYLDGQLYRFRVAIQGVATPRQHRFDGITVMVYDAWPVPDKPTWEQVEPILTQYGNLYPIMSQRLVDLGDYESVRENRELLRFVFALDIADPNHMPVTRDLSGPKRAMILRWLDSLELAQDEAGPPTRARTLRARVRPASATPARETASMEPKEAFANSYLGIPDVPADADTDRGAKT